jgi:hypothetical protein
MQFKDMKYRFESISRASSELISGARLRAGETHRGTGLLLPNPYPFSEKFPTMSNVVTHQHTSLSSSPHHHRLRIPALPTPR